MSTIPLSGSCNITFGQPAGVNAYKLGAASALSASRANPVVFVVDHAVWQTTHSLPGAKAAYQARTGQVSSMASSQTTIEFDGTYVTIDGVVGVDSSKNGADLVITLDNTEELIVEIVIMDKGVCPNPVNCMESPSAVMKFGLPPV